MKFIYLSVSFVIFLTTTMMYSFRAQAQMDIAINALAHANGVALSNPPMTSLYGSKGNYKLGLQMGLLDGVKAASGDIKTLDYSGYNFAGIYNYMFGNFWGGYILGSISKVSGEITAPGADNSGRIESTHLDSQLYMLSAGGSFHLLRNSWVSLPIFAGPAIVAGDVSGSFRHIDSNEVVLDDFDASTSPSYVGWIFGAQAAFLVNRHLSIIPYFMTIQPLNSDDKCQTYKTTSVRTSGNLVDQSSMGCMTPNGTNRNEIEFDIFVQTIGLNIAIPSIGLSFNVYNESGEVPYFEGTDLQFYSLSFSLGVP